MHLLLYLLPSRSIGYEFPLLFLSHCFLLSSPLPSFSIFFFLSTLSDTSHSYFGARKLVRTLACFFSCRSPDLLFVDTRERPSLASSNHLFLSAVCLSACLCLLIFPSYLPSRPRSVSGAFLSLSLGMDESVKHVCSSCFSFVSRRGLCCYIIGFLILRKPFSVALTS